MSNAYDQLTISANDIDAIFAKFRRHRLTSSHAQPAPPPPPDKTMAAAVDAVPFQATLQNWLTMLNFKIIKSNPENPFTCHEQSIKDERIYVESFVI